MTLAERRALRRAQIHPSTDASFARPQAGQSAQLALVPNDDKDELLASFRRPGGGREAGAPAPVEDEGLPAAAAPAAAALSPIAMTQQLRGTRVAVVDTETTGVDPLTCEIVEVAVVLIEALGEPGEPEVVLHTRVRPTQPIPPDATKVHGITDADVVDAPTWAEVAPRVREAVAGALPCAYNAPYDGQVLREVVPWGAWLDPLVLVRGLDQFEKGKRLTDAAGRRGIVLAEGAAHGAAADAMVTALLLPVLIREALAGARDRRGRVRLQAPAHPTVEAWLRWQLDQALAQERDLIAYHAGRRDPVDAVWHRLAGVAPPAAPLPTPRTATCPSCDAPILWIVAQGGRAHPVDPTEYQIEPEPADPADAEAWGRYNAIPGVRRVLWLPDGSLRKGREAPGGVWGRESHFSSCPHASRHRKERAP